MKTEEEIMKKLKTATLNANENKECDEFAFDFNECVRCPEYSECDFNPDNDNTLEELKNLRESIKLYNHENKK